VLAAYVVAHLFCLHLRADKRRNYFLSVLLIATCPRWVAYEPIAMFFRLGLYYMILDIALSSLDKFLHDLTLRESLV